MSMLLGSSTYSVKENLVPNLKMTDSDNIMEVKRELTMMRKDVKRLTESGAEKERDIERLKKENFNLINRCRNGMSKS